MKKGTVLGKSQIILAVMVVALGAAVWFNMQYSSSVDKGDTKFLGQADYVDNTSGDSVQTGASAKEDYFVTARKERDDARKATREELEELIKTAGKDSDAAASAVDKAASITARETAEANIEALLKAKGFTDVLAIIGDSDINLVVRRDALTAAETIQIQDICSNQSGYTADKIKILTVK